MAVAPSRLCQFSKTVRHTAQNAVNILAVIKARLISAAKVRKISLTKEPYHKKRGNTLYSDAVPFVLMRLFNACYETSIALVTFSFGSVFGMVMVRMPSSTLAEILSFTTSSGNT